MRRGHLASLIFIVVMAVGGLIATLLAGWSPALGLDLQGGVSVVLQPDREVPDESIEQSIAIIRQRVDALGVAEPEISRLGDTIVVQLPGVTDQERALDVVGQTAELRFRPVLQVLPPETEQAPADDATTTTTAPAEGETADTTEATDTTDTTEAAGEGATTTTSTTIPGTTARDEDLPDQPVVLPELNDQGEVVARYALGPALLTGEAVDTAQARAPQGFGEWAVDLNFTGEGTQQFNQAAAVCFDRGPECPTQQLAIVLDGVVQSAPVIREREFQGSAQITGEFSEEEAKNLALVLRFGALPVQLEPQEIRAVSATLGRDSLNAGLVAGIGGLVLVLLYVLFYYRALGVVVLMGIGVWAALNWTVISLLGAGPGLALSLAGAVGIIISIGITSDSYMVYFERLKDEIRSGRTVRSAVDRGFKNAFRTIVAADISSLIGAALLYFLTVGPVRGFALFLGLATMLDLIVAWFFTRPMVALLARNRVFTEARHVGLARGLAVDPARSPAT